MGVKSWPGGFVQPIPPTPGGPFQDSAAPGVWTLDQVAYWQKQGLWPTAGNALPQGTAVFFGGNNSGGSRINNIEYVSMTSLGNTSDFGDLTTQMQYTASVASSTRGVTAGGLQSADPQEINVINYVTIASTGNATDFGDLLNVTNAMGSCSSSTRGVFSNGLTTGDAIINVISYITIASTGNATDFGDATPAVEGSSGCASPTRGVYFGGRYISGDYVYINNINYITIASTGNSTDFGDTTVTKAFSAGLSSSTRGISAGGRNDSVHNVIDYITIASTGNATDFGDLTTQRWLTAGASGVTRGIIAGGRNNDGTNLNSIDYITISTLGNAIDFGDLLVIRASFGACSNTHGGL